MIAIPVSAIPEHAVVTRFVPDLLSGPLYLFRTTVRCGGVAATWRGAAGCVEEARLMLEAEWGGGWGHLVWFFGTDPFRY